MTDHQHPYLPPGRFFHKKIPYLSLGNQIQHGTDFIRNQISGSLPQRSRDAEPLQFPSGQFLRIPGFPVRFDAQPDFQLSVYVIRLFQGFPQVQYDEISHIIKIEKEGKKRIGKIAVCTAGTADIPVAEEAAQTAEFFGSNVDRIYDVGVSGIHRLMSRLDVIQSANCVVAVAGMEGALASVIGGLVSNPVLAVPTSVGYGANMNGLSALLTMINSCANGIAVLNIDNGYGAGYMATQINRLAERDGNHSFGEETEHE